MFDLEKRASELWATPALGSTYELGMKLAREAADAERERWLELERGWTRKFLEMDDLIQRAADERERCSTIKVSHDGTLSGTLPCGHSPNDICSDAQESYCPTCANAYTKPKTREQVLEEALREICEMWIPRYSEERAEALEIALACAKRALEKP